MANMDDREKAFENKFAYDQQMGFKIEARASKLFGLWAAELLGKTGDAAATYAKEVVASNLDEPGFDDVKRKVRGDFNAAEVEVSDHQMDTMLQAKLVEARQQLEAEAAAR